MTQGLVEEGEVFHPAEDGEPPDPTPEPEPLPDDAEDPKNDVVEDENAA